jgi:hypothetical protein
MTTLQTDREGSEIFIRKPEVRDRVRKGSFDFLSPGAV